MILFNGEEGYRLQSIVLKISRTFGLFHICLNGGYKMTGNLEQVDYKGIFKYFEEISKIPRGSGNEEGISNFLVAFAKEHHLSYIQDSAKNVIITKEASFGYEKEPGIILQGHMDMVCEKRKDNSHDFLKDGIRLIVEGDYIHADDTTLGADNGMAVAYMLAVLSDETLKTPRIEAVVTTDEEVGMDGARTLDTSSLQGKYLINIDSEEEGYLLCSCAGGLRGISTIPIKRVSEYGKNIQISIGGLKGGHSGSDINKNRTNATKLMGRLLFELKENYFYYLVDLQGGFKDNVIPRESSAQLLITAPDEKGLDEEFAKIKKGIADLMELYQQELSGSEPDLNYTLEDGGNGNYNALHPVSAEKVMFFLVNMPYGVQVMSANIEGLVESSLNLGIFKMEEDCVICQNCVRSSMKSYKYYISGKLGYMTDFLGGEYRVVGDYPVWAYKKDSPLRDCMLQVYRELYGKDMEVTAIHAGLECGQFANKMPDVDIVSIGPEMSGVHTIEEKLSISSAVRVYKFLEHVLCHKIG
jgi:dipeptidase D